MTEEQIVETMRDKNKALALIWKHTHKDYRGTNDGDKTIMMLRNGGACLVPLSALTDAEMIDKLKLVKIKEKLPTEITFIIGRVHSCNVSEYGISFTSHGIGEAQRFIVENLAEAEAIYARLEGEMRERSKAENAAYKISVSHFDRRSHDGPGWSAPRNGPKPRGFKKAIEPGGTMPERLVGLSYIMDDEKRALAKQYAEQRKAKALQMARDAAESAPEPQPMDRPEPINLDAIHAPTAEQVADYQGKLAAKVERYQDRAKQNEKEAQRRYEWVKHVASNLQGEPIKVGHHSERPHRALLRKLDNNMRKVSEHCDKARHYESKAESVGTAGIMSDDPEAVVKLRAQIETAEARQAHMNRVNKIWRKVGKPKTDNASGWALFAAEVGIEAGSLPRVDGSWHRGQPYQSFELSNNNANIKRMKDRLTTLARNAIKRQNGDASEKTIGNARVVENLDANRVQIFFPGKPSVECRTALKRRGFRWSRSEGAWQRHLADGVFRLAVSICNEFTD